MKIQALINELESIKKIRGSDIEVIVSVDPEGNSFSTLETQSISYVFQGEDDFVNAHAAGCLSGDAQKIVDDFYNHAKVVGICLYPWEEGFNTAEDACNWPKKLEEKRKEFGKKLNDSISEDVKAFKKQEEEELNRQIAKAENRLDAAKETGELL